MIDTPQPSETVANCQLGRHRLCSREIDADLILLGRAVVGRAMPESATCGLVYWVFRIEPRIPELFVYHTIVELKRSQYSIQ